MDISYSSSKQRKLLQNYKKLCQKFGKVEGENIVSRMDQLDAAKNLYDISMLPQADLHYLKGNYKGYFALSTLFPYRLIIEPLDGEMDDLKSITKIRIIERVNYHRGKYR